MNELNRLKTKTMVLCITAHLLQITYTLYHIKLFHK